MPCFSKACLISVSCFIFSFNHCKAWFCGSINKQYLLLCDIIKALSVEKLSLGKFWLFQVSISISSPMIPLMISFADWFSPPNDIGILSSLIFLAHSYMICSLYDLVKAPKYDIIPDDISISPMIFLAKSSKDNFFFFHSSFSFPKELFNIVAFFNLVLHWFFFFSNLSILAFASAISFSFSSFVFNVAANLSWISFKDASACLNLSLLSSAWRFKGR